MTSCARKIRDTELFPLEVGLWIRDHVDGIGNEELTAAVNERFGTVYTKQQIRAFKKNHRLASGLSGQFEKGQVPWTKGRKISEIVKSEEALERSKRTRFKKGNRPHNAASIGTEVEVTMKTSGNRAYIKVKVADPNVWEWKHHLVWMKHHGPIPPGYNVVFKDGDSLNCDPDNLMLLSKGAHSVANGRGYRIAGEAGLRLAELEQLIRKKEKENE